jgi:hypothetical protein
MPALRGAMFFTGCDNHVAGLGSAVAFDTTIAGAANSATINEKSAP